MPKSILQPPFNYQLPNYRVNPLAVKYLTFAVFKEQGWLAQCQYKVTGWGNMFICGMVLRCAGTLK